jgi:hypothetical protein
MIEKDETPRAAAAFAEYAAMGPGRTLEGLCEKRAQSAPKASHRLATFKGWSAKYHWQERVKEYDRVVIDRAAEERRKQLNEAIEAMNERHIDIALNLQLKLIQRLDELMEAENFGAAAWVSAMRLATDLERLARGEPTQITSSEYSGPGGEAIGFRAVIVLPTVEEVQHGGIDHGYTLTNTN